MSFNPFTSPFACTLNQQSVFARYPNPAFVLNAFAEVEPLFCLNSIEIEGMPGICIEFDAARGVPSSPKKDKSDSSDDNSSDDESDHDDTDGSFRFMRISSIPVPYNISDIKADRFAILYQDARFIAYLKAIIAKALIDHFLVNRMLTRESIMTTKFNIIFSNDYYERPTSNFRVHMDIFQKSDKIHVDTFSLTFLVPPDVVIRGTTIMAAGKHSPKKSVSVPIVNGMSLLIKQFHDKGELFWHSTPQHDSSAGERDYTDSYKFHELPIVTSSIPRETMTTIHATTSSLRFRKIIRNTYLTIDPAIIEASIKFQLQKKHKYSQKYSQINNKLLSALTFDAPWLNEIIAFVEWVAATMPPPLNCHDETHESVDAMIGVVGAASGVGGYNKHINKRSNKCGNKRSNKRSNKHKSKRTKYKRSHKMRK